MDMIDNILKLLADYPAWAKASLLAALAVIAAILIFARSPLVPPPTTPFTENSPLFLRISRIALFPEDQTAEVQLIASVNGTEYTFPSVANVKWMRVGPDMNQKIIPIPSADNYEIRFRLNYKSGRRASNEEPHKITRRTRDKISQLTPIQVSSDYKLYPVDGGTASPAVIAVVSYRIGPDGQ